jgi:hypothetical protein
VFFAWSREKRSDGGLGWLESARRSNFATLVSSHQDASAGPGPASPAATHPAATHPASARPASARPASARPASSRPASGRGDENVDDDEHLAAYNAFLARINKPQDG